MNETFNKKKRRSKIFKKDHWVVNSTPETALKDGEIADSGLTVYTESEVSMISTINPRALDIAVKAIQKVKELVSPASLVVAVNQPEFKGIPAKNFFVGRNEPDPEPKPELPPTARKQRNEAEKSDKKKNMSLF